MADDSQSMASFLVSEAVLEPAEMPSNRVSFIMDGNAIDMRLSAPLCTLLGFVSHQLQLHTLSSARPP